jgi:hypothetical protein
MGGFFLDDVIRMVARNVQRGVRASRAAKWPVVEARVLRFRTDEGIGHRLRPIVVYSYEVNHETQYGSATGFPVGHREINQIGDSVDALMSVCTSDMIQWILTPIASSTETIPTYHSKSITTSTEATRQYVSSVTFTARCRH